MGHQGGTPPRHGMRASGAGRMDFLKGSGRNRHSAICSSALPDAEKRKQVRMPPAAPSRLTVLRNLSGNFLRNRRRIHASGREKGRGARPSRQKWRTEIGKEFFPKLPLISSLGKISVPGPEGIPCSSERRLPQEGNKVHPERRRPPESLIKAGKRRMYLVPQMGGSPPVPADGRAALLKQVPRRLRPRSPAPGPAAELLCGAGGIPGDALLTAS